jgi:glycosyltransferase involved in cell wall biosynthesis
MIYQTPPKVGYIVKMYPRLSETFILNEILQHERCGAEITIFSYKKPNEGHFHPQVAQVKAKVFYLEDLDPRKWPTWLGKVWGGIEEYHEAYLRLLGEALSMQDNERIELIMASAWVASQAKERGITHLHAHFASLPSTIAYLTHRITGIPFSFTAHAKDIFVYDMDEHYLREKLRAARFVVTVTNFNYQYLIEREPEIGPEKIQVIYNGVELEQFKADAGRVRDLKMILSVGRLVPKKGFSYLLDACGLLKQRGTNFHCVIVGEGPDGDMLLQKRRELGLDNAVTFVGPKRQDEVLGLMQEASILCLPCTIADDGNQDALPTVLLEALATGLPCVSTTVSGIPEIIDSDEDGLLVGPNDAAALSNALERLLKSQPLRDRFSAAGRIKAEEKFDLRKNAGSLLELFRASQQKALAMNAVTGAPW